MINLPFHKWKLNFFSSEFEIAYEEHLNKVRLLSFRILNLFILIAAVICLITFIAQQQPFYVTIMMAGVVGGCFGMLLISRQLEPRLKSVFSFYYIWALSTNVLIAFSGFEVPLFIFGFNTSCLAMGIMQYSDNKLKIVYSILTPIVLLAIFDVYKADSLHFVFQTVACTIFIGIWSYMNEYTSRLAFSLNLIANKQKDLMNEFISDGMIALSLEKFTRQFQVELNNNKFMEIAKSQFHQNLANSNCFDSKENDCFKYFLRNSFVLSSSRSDKKLTEKNLGKYQKLEDFCYTKIHESSEFLGYASQTEKVEIAFGLSKNEEINIMEVQIRKLDFGKPMLLLIVKAIEEPHHKEKYHKVINEYEKLIVKISEKQIQQLVKLYKEIKLIRPQNSQDVQKQNLTVKLQCSNMQMMNQLQNYIFYFLKKNLCQQNQNLDNSQFQNYLNTLEQYFKCICNQKGLQFEISNLIFINLKTVLNIKYLTQILTNIINEILQFSNQLELIILKVSEEIPQYIDVKKEVTSIIETKRKMDDSQACSKQIFDQRRIIFTFLFESQEEIDIKIANPQLETNKLNLLNEDYIVSQVTQILLREIGPNDNIQVIQQINRDTQKVWNIVSIQIYSDQSLIEPSFLKYMNNKF